MISTMRVKTLTLQIRWGIQSHSVLFMMRKRITWVGKDYSDKKKMWWWGYKTGFRKMNKDVSPLSDAQIPRKKIIYRISHMKKKESQSQVSTTTAYTNARTKQEREMVLTITISRLLRHNIHHWSHISSLCKSIYQDKIFLTDLWCLCV